jgi:hypothetical protein
MITGVHSLVIIDAVTVSAMFDIVPDASGSGGSRCRVECLTREDLCGFGQWLASGFNRDCALRLPRPVRGRLPNVMRRGPSQGHGRCGGSCGQD